MGLGQGKPKEDEKKSWLTFLRKRKRKKSRGTFPQKMMKKEGGGK
jgi:hypothetical protein